MEEDSGGLCPALGQHGLIINRQVVASSIIKCVYIKAVAARPITLTIKYLLRY